MPPWLIVSHKCVRYYFTMDLPSAVAVVTVRLFPRARAVVEAEIAFIRKAAHFTEYAVLGIFLCILILRKRNTNDLQTIIVSLIIALFIAAIDEFVQNFTGRSSMVKDVIIDLCGATTGILLTCTFSSRRGQ